MKLSRHVIAGLALGLFVATASAQGLVARTNAPQVATGDSFQLSLTTEGAGNVAPDLSPLDQDFVILGTSRSSQTQIINGRRSDSTSWIVTLSPRSTGTVTIPAISAGTATSDPLDLNVVEASELPRLQGTDGIAVTASVADGAHYRFQEIPLTVRIEASRDLQSAELIEPTGDFELTRNGEDRQGQITRDGQPVNVVERSYLLRPENEGTISIDPFTLKGAVRDPDAPRDPFASMRSGFGGRDTFAMMQQMMGQMGSRLPAGFGSPGTPFVARSEPITLDVQASPGASSWFLPATSVQLTGEWQPDGVTYREGEAATRRISLLALGAHAEQLPDLTFDEPEGARLYLDDVQTDEARTAEGTVARKDFLISVVPTRAGDVQLPAISVEWLDTATGELQVASLPAETLQVEAATPATASHATAAATPADAADAPDGTAGVNILANKNLAHPDADSPWTWWPALAAALLLMAGAGIALWRRRERSSSKGADGTNGSRSSRAASISGHALPALRQAARDNDTARFYAALLALRTSPGKLDPARITAAMETIDSRAYGPQADTGTIDLSALLSALLKRRDGSAKSTRRGQSGKLPPLYPPASSA